MTSRTSDNNKRSRRLHSLATYRFDRSLGLLGPVLTCFRIAQRGYMNHSGYSIGTLSRLPKLKTLPLQKMLAFFSFFSLSSIFAERLHFLPIQVFTFKRPSWTSTICNTVQAEKAQKELASVVYGSDACWLVEQMNRWHLRFTRTHSCNKYQYIEPF